MSSAPPAAIIPPDEEQHAVDAQILQRIAAGDQSALGELYDRWAVPLYSVALRILGDSAEAEDILHDTFVTLWDQAADYTPTRGHAFSWAVTLTRRHALDRLRSRPRYPASPAPARPAAPALNENTPVRDSSHHLWLQGKASAVRAAVATLPSDQREALDLACFGGLTPPRIAEKLSAPLGTVKTRLRLALFALRDDSELPAAMADERHAETAALHALDLLDPAERSAFEAGLARDRDLRHLAARLHDTAADLAHLVPPAAPSAALRARIMASAAARSTTPPDHVVPVILPPWAGWAAAAGFLLATAYFAIANFNTRSQFDTLREDARLASIETRNLTHLLEAERLLSDRQIADLKTARLDLDALRRETALVNFNIIALSAPAGASTLSRATVLWNPATQEGLLSVTRLPLPAPDQAYQLWIIDPAYPDPVDAGIFQVDPNGGARLGFKPGKEIKTAAKFSISLAPKGGSPRPQAPAILLGE